MVYRSVVCHSCEDRLASSGIYSIDLTLLQQIKITKHVLNTESILCVQDLSDTGNI